MLLLRYFPIQMDSLSLSPLVVPFLYPMQPIINIIYISEPCALLVNRIRLRVVITLGVIADTIYIQLLQVRHSADAQGNLQRRDSAESLLVSLTSVWACISLSSPARYSSSTGVIRGYSSLVRSAGVSAPPGRYEDNPLQFFPLVTLSNHLKCTIESDSFWLYLLVGT